MTQTQDWTRMLKSFRAKPYRNLPTADDHKAASHLNDDDALCRKLFPESRQKAGIEFRSGLCVIVWPGPFDPKLPPPDVVFSSLFLSEISYHMNAQLTCNYYSIFIVAWVIGCAKQV